MTEARGGYAPNIPDLPLPERVVRRKNGWNPGRDIRNDVEKKKGNEVTMIIDGHHVTITFSAKPDISVARKVRDCLIDSYIQNYTTK